MSKQGMQKGVVVVVSGPSGVGKSTICRQAIRRLDNAHLSVSVTTRQKSETEVDGTDYRYVSREEFQEMIGKGLLLEYAEVFGNFYGTPKDKVEEALSAGKVIILEIDVQGGKQIKAAYPEAVMIFILAPTQRELAERMYGRGREDGETAKRRLDAASAEVATAWQYYEHMVINDNLEEAVKEVIGIIQAARGAGKKPAAVRRKKLERNE